MKLTYKIGLFKAELTETAFLTYDIESKICRVIKDGDVISEKQYHILTVDQFAHLCLNWKRNVTNIDLYMESDLNKLKQGRL